ncbi:MAG: DUF3124 domain-containing protein [Crocinitomicaceae bacterium]|nr:DUF3124 domain-containing protein [Crocinitomicaceae bacterium]
MKLKAEYLYYSFIALFVLTVSCTENEKSEIHEFDWNSKQIDLANSTNLEKGQTYLSIYSSIYSFTEQSTTNLTATASIRNINTEDTVYVTNASYYNTKGELVRTYFDFPIYLAPLETIEIVVHQQDETGGTGGNFIFEWLKDSTINEPYFEAVMISMSAQQGLSFSTKGQRLIIND